MTRRGILLTALALLVIAACVTAAVSWFAVPGAAVTQDGPMVCEDDSVSAPSRLLDGTFDDVTLVSMERKPVMLRDLAGKRLTVVVFCSYLCPCSDGYIGRLKDLRGRYENEGVAFVAIHSSANEDMDGMQRYIRQKQYPLPVFRDAPGAAADALGAAVTPEAFVFDDAWKLRYHGRIDDEKSGNYVTHQTLRCAIDTLLSGAQLTVREQPALGCAISRNTTSGV